MKYSNPCTNKDCSICHTEINEGQDGCVTRTPKAKLSRLSKTTISKFHIKWNMDLSKNYFHFNCWKNLVPSGRTEQRIIDYCADVLERYDGSETIIKIVKEVVLPIFKNSTKTICFSGAGISASAGIPTYRGVDGIDTVQEMDAKVENEDNKKRKRNSESDSDDEEEDFDYNTLHPTFSHLMLAELNSKGMMDYCITQNCDDLHAKAGFPRQNLVELHGNVFVEYCQKCEKQYIRDYCVDQYSTDCYNESWYRKCPTCSFNHFTGRICTEKSCKGKLRDTIVNFGDDLHEKVLGGIDLAINESKHADVCICVGSSLSVSPANTLPRMAKKLIIVNLQDTDLDDKADCRIYAPSDFFFFILQNELNGDI
eukprot:gene12212-16361_t